MISKDVLILLGGITATTVIAVLVISELKKKANKTMQSNINIIKIMEFSISDLKQWCAKNNPDSESKVCVLTLDSLKRNDSNITTVLKVYAKEIPNNGNCLFLVSIDSKENIKILEIVIYDCLDEGLKKLLDENNGILILEPA